MSSSSPARAALFDMDGLLIDSEPLWHAATDSYCRRRGAAYTNDDAAACVGRGIAHSVAHLASRYGWAASVDRDVEEITDSFVARVPSAPALPRVDELLRALHARAVPLALGSSSARRVVDAALAGRGWFELFGAVVTGSDVARVKPAPDVYLAAARALGVAPETCVVFEDSAAGCAAGRAAGMLVVAVPAADADPAHVAALAAVAHVVAPDVAQGALATGLLVEPIVAPPLARREARAYLRAPCRRATTGPRGVLFREGSPSAPNPHAPPGARSC